MDPFLNGENDTPADPREMGKRLSEEISSSGKRSKAETIADEGVGELLVNPEKPWYLIKIKEAWEITGPRPGGAAELSELTKKAAEVYGQQAALYDQQREMSKSDRDWLKTVMTSGTTSDKCSTFQVQIAEAPVYGAVYLQKLLELARSTSRHESSQAIQALEKVFGTVLPPAGIRKLYYLKQRLWERGIHKLSKKTLVILHFEETVKKAFFEYLKLVEIMAQDQIAHSRELGMRTLCNLATKHDEQQGNMIALLANKLGDPDRKLASRSLYYLQEVINGQREATELVIGQVEQIIQRPGVSEKAQYYGLTFLSQVMLTHDQPGYTEKLVKIYLSILKTIIIPSIQREAEKAKAAKKTKNQRRKGKKDRKTEVEAELAPATSRLAKVVTTGLNRALPYYKGSMDLVNELQAPIIKLIQTGSFSTSLQALSLYFQIASVDKTNGLSTDFIKTVEQTLEKPEVLTETSVHPQLLALLYKILVSPDLSAQLTETLVKLLFKLAVKIPSLAFTLSSLLILGELLGLKPSLWTAINIPSDSPEDSCLWIIQIFEQHFDSRVRQLAKSILEGAPCLNILSGANPFEACTAARQLSSIA